MNEFKVRKICPITGWKIISSKRDYRNIFYEIKNQNIVRGLYLSIDSIEFAKSNKEVIRWLLYNDRFPNIKNSDDESIIKAKLITTDLIKEVISETFIPITPREKFDNFLILLYSIFPSFQGKISYRKLFHCTFFNSKNEIDLYLKSLLSKKYLDVKGYGILDNEELTDDDLYFKFTFEGLNYISSLEKNNRYSNRCFIAMSFSVEPKIREIRDTIRSAIEATKNQPIFIDEAHYESNKTINDAILAEIKKSKFLVADFTEQKEGVYFEAGFALGLGLPVIYCCHDDDFKNSHFDLNHYPHIIYKTNDELREALKNKIEAWID